MLRLIKTRLSFAKVLGGVAVLLLVTTGTAYAANEWTGANIVNGSLTTDDYANNDIQAVDILNGTLTGLDIADGSITTDDIANNNLKGQDIRTGTLTTADMADESLTGTDVADGSLGGADVADGSLDGADVSQLHGDFDIIDNTISTFDIATNAIDSDEVLDFGLSNQDVGVLFATVNFDGTLANSSGSVTSFRIGAAGSGTYEVDFARNITSCAFTGTVGPAGGGSALGELNVADRAGNANAVFVDTNNSDGVGADKPFHLIVVC